MSEELNEFYNTYETEVPRSNTLPVSSHWVALENEENWARVKIMANCVADDEVASLHCVKSIKHLFTSHFKSCDVDLDHQESISRPIYIK